MILPCTCTHAAQDRLHGNSRRVHNPQGDGKVLKCTVCGTEKKGAETKKETKTDG